jgi:hypothetical protein
LSIASSADWCDSSICLSSDDSVLSQIAFLDFVFPFVVVVVVVVGLVVVVKDAKLVVC